MSVKNSPTPQWQWAETECDGLGRMAVTSIWPNPSDLQFGQVQTQSGEGRPCLLWVLMPANNEEALKAGRNIKSDALRHGVPTILLATDSSEKIGLQVVSDHVQIFNGHGQTSWLALDFYDLTDLFCAPHSVVLVRNMRPSNTGTSDAAAESLAAAVAAVTGATQLGVVIGCNFQGQVQLPEITRLRKLVSPASQDEDACASYFSVIHDPRLAEQEVRITCLVSS